MSEIEEVTAKIEGLESKIAKYGAYAPASLTRMLVRFTKLRGIYISQQITLPPPMTLPFATPEIIKAVSKPQVKVVAPFAPTPQGQIASQAYVERKAIAVSTPKPKAAPPLVPKFEPLAEIATAIFPPLGIITKLPPGGEKVLAAVPKAAVEAVFPPASWISGKLPGQTLWEAEQKRQIDISPLPEAKKEQIWEQLQDMTPTMPTLPTIPSMLPTMPDFKDVGKYALIAAVALGGLFFAGSYLGRGK